ncbi:MAG: redoxin domain-containing protein [Gemmatimonadetes bacterium]|nr:redoxin domain-containing protein [Gemmatimonadota bacterium]MBI3566911.1 redoxin domain-containing protein [Gemmatimonadota bacterium]
MTTTIAAGQTAPDFTLDATGGTPVSLSAFRGKQHVLLAFFPLAFTSTCTAELCAFTDDYSAFASKDVAVVPISVDAVPSLKVFKAQHQMAVELASDFKREVARAYGVLNEEKFFANRAYVLIDKQGVVRWSHVEAVNGQRRENAEILAEIAKLGA